MRPRAIYSLLFLCLCQTALAQGVGAIRGGVVNQIGDTVSSVKVRVEEKRSFQGQRLSRSYKTDKAGRFEVRVLPWGTYVLMARKKTADIRTPVLRFIATSRFRRQPYQPSRSQLQCLPSQTGASKSALLDTTNGRILQQPERHA
jgi:hypothetical protein